jgi:hypothetical protein
MGTRKRYTLIKSPRYTDRVSLPAWQDLVCAVAGRPRQFDDYLSDLEARLERNPLAVEKRETPIDRPLNTSLGFADRFYVTSHTFEVNGASPRRFWGEVRVKYFIFRDTKEILLCSLVLTRVP